MKKFLLICMIISACSIPTFVGAEELDQELLNEESTSIEAPVTTPQKVLKASDKTKYDNLCNKANESIDKNKYEQAESLIQKALAISPDEDMAYALKARISLRKNKNNEEGKKWADKALSINPDNYIANNILGVVSDNPNSDIAIKYYEKSLAVKKDYIPALLNTASSYANNKNPQKAVEYYTKYLNIASKEDLKKEDCNGYIYRAVQYRILKKYDSALKDINSALLLNKNNPYALAEQGFIYALKGNFKDAVKSVNKSIKLGENTKDPIFYVKRVYIYKLMNTDYLMVQKDIKTIESLAGNDPIKLHELLNLYVMYSKQEDINRICNKILAIEPENQKILLQYASSLASMGKLEEALDTYNKIADCKMGLDGLSVSDRAKYYYDLGLTKYRVAGLDNKNLINEAIGDLKNSYDLEKNDSYYYMGNGYLINGDYKNAYNSYKKSLLDYYEKNEEYDDFRTIHKLLLLSELATYNNYNAKNQNWSVPNWMLNDEEIPHYGWEDLPQSLKLDLADRINYSNGIPEIDDKDYILSTIKMLNSGTGEIGKIYNLHINNDNFGNTSRVFVYPYSDASDGAAKKINSDDYDMLIANQYYLLIKNCVGSIPHPYPINQSDLDNFFYYLNRIPENTAINLINDIADYSTSDSDFFDDEAISVSFYNQMLQYLNDNSLTNYSKKTKKNVKIAYIVLGDFYLKQDDISMAIYEYNCAIPYGASKFEINEFIGNYYFDTKNYFKANEYYTKALGAKANAYVYLSRGQARTHLQDYDGAIADFNKAIGYNKNLAEAYWERGQVLFDQKKYSIALNDYVKYASMNKNSVAARYNAGICLYNTGKRQAALPYIESAKATAQRVGDQELYNKCVRLINEIKGYKRGWYY